MERHGDEVHITTEEARGGRSMKIMRFVLAISLLLAVVALALVWAATRATAHDTERLAMLDQVIRPVSAR